MKIISFNILIMLLIFSFTHCHSPTQQSTQSKIEPDTSYPNKPADTVKTIIDDATSLDTLILNEASSKNDIHSPQDINPPFKQEQMRYSRVRQAYDDKIKELYLLAIEAKSSGQDTIPVHIFPKRLSSENFQSLQQNSDSLLIDFWTNLKKGYDFFEQYRIEPDINIEQNGQYNFRSRAQTAVIDEHSESPLNKTNQNPLNHSTSKKIEWITIDSGLHYSSIEAPVKSQIGDSRIDVLRIDPTYFDFQLVLS